MNQPLDPPQPPSGGPPSDTPPPPPGDAGSGGGSGFSPPPAGGGGGGGGAGGATPPGNPWEQRDRLGFVNAFIENIKLFALSPAEAFAQTRRTGDFVGPLIFGVLVGWIGYIFSQLWGMVLGGGMMSMMPAEMREGMGSQMMFQGGTSILGIIFYPVLGVIGLFIAAGIIHLCAMLVGAVAESDSGFEGTFRVAAFASVANLASIIPIVGGLIGLVWGIFLWVVGLSTLHRTTQSKALMAVLIPVVLCCLCIIAVVFFGAAGFMAAMSNQ